MCVISKNIIYTCGIPVKYVGVVTILCYNNILLHKVEQNREYRIHKLQGQKRVASSPYMNLRSVFLRKMLRKGRYIIIPTTFHPNIRCNFILRIFTDVQSEFRYAVCT